MEEYAFSVQHFWLFAAIYSLGHHYLRAMKMLQQTHTLRVDIYIFQKGSEIARSNNWKSMFIHEEDRPGFLRYGRFLE